MRSVPVEVDSSQDTAPQLADDLRWQAAQRVAQSPLLARATQLRAMLLFIVQQTILQPDAAIPEFEIAYQALGRRKDFNPLNDNIVRVQMAHLRKRLDLYYATEGKEDTTIISIALGSYRPLFKQRPQTVAPTPELPEPPASPLPQTVSLQQITPVPRSRSKMRRRFFYALAATVPLLLATCTALILYIVAQNRQMLAQRTALTPWRQQPAIAALWSVFFDSAHDTDIVIGDNSLLMIEQIAGQYISLNNYLNHSYATGSEVAALPSDRRFAVSLAASKNLVSLGESTLAERLRALDPLNARVHIYSARQYSSPLLRQDNVILIGARSSNPWASIIESKLNFNQYMEFKDLGRSRILNRTPLPGEQVQYESSDEAGYCLIAYLPSPAQGTALLLIEGSSAEATEAASDFLLSQEQLSLLLEKMRRRNFPAFELLLKTSQVKGTPLTATVAAYRIHDELP